MNKNEAARERTRKWAAELYAEYQSGKSLKELAVAHNRTKQRIHQIFVAYGYKLRPPHNHNRSMKRDQIDIDAIWKRYDAGEPSIDLAKEFNINRTYLLTLFRKAGYDNHPRGRKKWLPDKIAEMYADYQTGLNQTEVAEKYKTKQTIVSMVFRREGYSSKR